MSQPLPMAVTVSMHHPKGEDECSQDGRTWNVIRRAEHGLVDLNPRQCVGCKAQMEVTSVEPVTVDG